MNIYKFLGIYNKSQRELLNKDMKRVIGLAEKLASDRNDEIYKATNEKNTKCPICSGRGKYTVDIKKRVIHHPGEYVTRTFLMPMMVGKMWTLIPMPRSEYKPAWDETITDRREYSKCENCGHEWEWVNPSHLKYKYIDMIKYNLKYLIDRDSYHYRNSFKSLFDGCYIQTIKELVKQCHLNIKATKDFLEYKGLNVIDIYE